MSALWDAAKIRPLAPDTPEERCCSRDFAAREPQPAPNRDGSGPAQPVASPAAKEGVARATSPREPSSSRAVLQRENVRVFARVPTHVVGVASDRRHSPRAHLRLPLYLRAVEGQHEPVSVTLLTQNISSSGVYFLCPRWIAPGSAIELEVGLVDRPLGRGSVRMTTAAHVVRSELAQTPGWHGIAVRFDDFDFERDEAVPPRYLKP